jgi:hypothetical protein
MKKKCVEEAFSVESYFPRSNDFLLKRASLVHRVLSCSYWNWVIIAYRVLIGIGSS